MNFGRKLLVAFLLAGLFCTKEGKIGGWETSPKFQLRHMIPSAASAHGATVELHCLYVCSFLRSREAEDWDFLYLVMACLMTCWSSAGLLYQKSRDQAGHVPQTRGWRGTRGGGEKQFRKTCCWLRHLKYMFHVVSLRGRKRLGSSLSEAPH